jgi:O-antigen/teichoic acid export membrane protein
MLGLAIVGQVSVATYLAEWLWYVPSILGNLLFAVVAADRGALSVQRVARSARLVAAMLVPAMIVLMILGRWLVLSMYGPAYGQAGLLFTILLPGMTALGLHLVIDSFFAGSGFPPITFGGAIVALAAKVGLNLVVVPRYGALGAATVTSLIYVSLLIVKMTWFRHTTGVAWKDLLMPNRSDVIYLKDRVLALAGTRGGAAA